MSNIRYLKTPVGNTYIAFFSSIYGSFVDKALYGTKYVLRGFKKNWYKGVVNGKKYPYTTNMETI